MLSNYIARCLNVYEENRTRRLMKQMRLVMLPVEEYEFLSERRLELQVGRECLKSFERLRQRLLHRLYTRRNTWLWQDQVRLLDGMRDTTILSMYNNSIVAVERDRHWLRESFRVIELYDVVFVVYPRRAGKTMTEAIFAACIMLSQRDGNVLAVSPRQAQARQWLDALKEMMDLMKDDDEFGFTELEHRAGEIFKVRANFTGDVVETISRGNAASPQHVDSLRGGGKRIKVLIVDESDFTCREAKAVIYPMTANGCALVETSSRALKDSTMAEIRDIKYKDGTRIVHSIEYRSKCSECVTQERETGVDVRCKHILPSYNHVRSRTTNERSEALLTPFDAWDREMLNIQAAAHVTRIFQKDWIESCLGIGAPKVGQLPTIRRFYVALDPGAMGQNSDSACVSFCFVHGAPGIQALPDTLDPLDQHLIVRPRYIRLVRGRQRDQGQPSLGYTMSRARR